MHHDLDGHDRAASGARQRPADVHLVCAAAHFTQKSVRHRKHQLTIIVFRGVGHYLADAEAHEACPRQAQARARGDAVVFDNARRDGVFNAACVLLFRNALHRVAFEQPALPVARERRVRAGITFGTDRGGCAAARRGLCLCAGARHSRGASHRRTFGGASVPRHLFQHRVFRRMACVRVRDLHHLRAGKAREVPLFCGGGAFRPVALRRGKGQCPTL